MGLKETPSADRVSIGFFGKRNSGKSSLINAITTQNISVVSDVPGTTTDPVSKAMELLPVGPVLLVDTAGVDDEGELGSLRVKKTYGVLRRIDVAVLVTDGKKEVSEEEIALAEELEKREIPFLVAVNKTEELSKEKGQDWERFCPNRDHVFVSATKSLGIEQLKSGIAKLAAGEKKQRPLVSDLVQKGDLVVLVTPLDAAAPKGRLILPQQQTIRELLEAGAMTVILQPEELPGALKVMIQKPKMVITDSQVFAKVSSVVPEDVILTSFSVLFARYKGFLRQAAEGAAMLDHLEVGDKVLICEGCTHHRQCGDIGTEKLPAWIKKHTGTEIDFTWTAGQDFPEDLSSYRLVIHCGGCMLAEKEMKYRTGEAKRQRVALTNYGTAIAHMNGILERSMKLNESDEQRNEI